MKIKIITVGKIKESYMADAIKDYFSRIKKLCPIEIIEVKEEKTPKNLNESIQEIVKRKESDRLFEKAQGFIVVTDRLGKKMGSIEFSNILQKHMNEGTDCISFLIGGSFGISEDLINRANLKLSISAMTFPHQLARLLILEQIYRGLKIINNHTYHK